MTHVEKILVLGVCVGIILSVFLIYVVAPILIRKDKQRDRTAWEQSHPGMDWNDRPGADDKSRE